MADTEGTLRANSDLLAKLAKQVPGVIYQFRMFPDGRSCFPFATEAMWDIYEVTPEEVREDASVAFTRIHPEDLAEGVRSIQESARTLEPWQWDYRVVLPVQGLRWRSGTARPERLADGSTLWHGFITDITERQEAQVALAESEERYRVLIEHAPEAIVVYDADTNRYTDANQHALDLFGMTRPSLVRRRCSSGIISLTTDGSSPARCVWSACPRRRVVCFGAASATSRAESSPKRTCA